MLIKCQNKTLIIFLFLQMSIIKIEGAIIWEDYIESNSQNKNKRFI